MEGHKFMYEFIKHPKDREKLTAMGENAFDAAEEYLVRSPEWEVSANGVPMTVFAVPVTRGGLHSFVSLPFSENLNIKAVSRERKIESAQLSPASLNVGYTIEDNSISFCPPKAHHYCIQLNGGFHNALTVSVRPPVALVNPDARVFGEGFHLISTLDILSGGEIFISEGAVLKAVPPEDETPLCDKDWAGKKNYRAVIECHGAKNISIRGGGILDLSGLDWHARSPFCFVECENLTVEGITVVGSPSWNLIVHRCKNVYINDVRLYGHRENSDGIDIVSSECVLVENCFIRTGDDAICVKAMSRPPVCGGRDITVRKCVVWNDKVRCYGITSETRNDIDGVRFTDCDIIRSFADWTEEIGSLCVIVCDGGKISNIEFDDIRIEHEVQYVMNCQIMKDKWSSDSEIGGIDGVTFRNINAPAGVPSRFVGFDETHKIKNVTVSEYHGKGIPAIGDFPVITEFTEKIAINK